MNTALDAESVDHATATRHTLSENWRAIHAQLDWMSAPFMAEYVNGMVSGKSLNAGGHWAIYASENFAKPLLDRMKELNPSKVGLELLAVACGEGHVERSLVADFGWPVSAITLLEYDTELRARAVANLSNLSGLSVDLAFFDFNGGAQPERQFDVVFAHHCLHHATNLEELLEFLGGSLKEDGLIIGSDYFGPTRFQIEYDVLPVIRELFSYLPPHLRKDLTLREGVGSDVFRGPTIEDVRRADPSEAIRSSDLRTLLFSAFEVVTIKPMGGTILRWLLRNCAGNLDASNSEHVTISRLLQFIERELMSSHRIKSDDLFFVLKKKI